MSYQELNEHKRKDTIKWVAVFLAVIILAVAVSASLTQGFKTADPFCWFGHDYGEDNICVRCGEEKPVEDEETAIDNGGMQLSAFNGNGITLMSVDIPVAMFGEYDIMPTAESAQQITATITPAEAEYVGVDWTVEWKNKYSTWANGKTVTDYVTVVPTSDGALTANVSCLQPFAEQILIRATLRVDMYVSATATVDYRKKLTSVTYHIDDLTGTHGSLMGYALTISSDGDKSVNWKWLLHDYNSYPVNNWSDFTYSFSSTFSVGTLDDPVTKYYVNVKLSPELQSALDTLQNQQHTGFYNSDNATYDSTNPLTQGNLFKSGGIFAPIGVEKYPDYYSLNEDKFNKLCTAMLACSYDFQISAVARTESGASLSTGFVKVNVVDSSLVWIGAGVSLNPNIVF